MAKKNALLAGLDGLISQANTTPAVPEAKPKRAKKVYKTVCYSINPELDEKIKYIAYYDRKKINAVVSEALAAYIEQWTPAPNEKPRKL